MELTLQSEVFANGDSIPRRYTCKGDDISPPLAWRDAPAGAGAFALVMDDPDAPGGTWVHWVLFNLPGTAKRLPEDVSGAGTLPAGTADGTNSWGRRGYGGPCPPSGTHRYFFRLYALDGVLDLDPGATAAELAQAVKGRVLSESVLMGRYARG
jgi:Raf kinase inhibitor-like YbhB/YbcL family protein